MHPQATNTKTLSGKKKYIAKKKNVSPSRWRNTNLPILTSNELALYEQEAIIIQIFMIIFYHCVISFLHRFCFFIIYSVKLLVTPQQLDCFVPQHYNSRYIFLLCNIFAAPITAHMNKIVSRYNTNMHLVTYNHLALQFKPLNFTAF